MTKRWAPMAVSASVLLLAVGQSPTSAGEIFPSVPPYVTGVREAGSPLYCQKGTWPVWVATSYSWARTSFTDGVAAENIQPSGPGSQTYLTKPSDANTFIHCNEVAVSAGGDYGFWSSSPVFIRPKAAAGKLRKVAGTRKADTLRGTGRRERMLGGSGNDRLLGKGNADTLSGGRGLDKVLGGPGNDLLDGGPDADRLSGGPGHDTIFANDGEPGDRVSCGSGNDLVILDEGDAVASDCEYTRASLPPK